MSESVSTLFESQTSFPAPSARLTPSQVLESYLQSRGKPSMAPRVSLLPNRFEQSLPQIHHDAEHNPKPTTILSTEKLRKIIERKDKIVRILERAVRRQNKRARSFDRKINHYRNKYRVNNYAIKTIGYNLYVKDEEIDKLNRELRRYETHIGYI
jgi:hypothetical protein